MASFKNDHILTAYYSAIERCEKMVEYLQGNAKRHYPTIYQELIHYIQDIDEILVLETGDFTIALFQIKQQLKALLQIVAQRINQEQTSGITQTTVKGLRDIIGLETTIKTLKTIVILPQTQPQLFLNGNICNTILLFGPPGTGKTKLVHALAAESRANLHCIGASDVMSHYVGETEKALNSIFANLKASLKFSILFIDEIDGFCRKRTEGEQDYSRRIKTELMCQLSNVEGCRNLMIICATNCPWDLDTAILRRFHKRVYIPLPDQSERLEFFKCLLGNHFDCTTVDFNCLLEKTHGYSGSDLFNLVESALHIPIVELEDTKIWNYSEGVYQPAMDHFSYVVCSALSDLPPNSVRARKVQMIDLLSASESVNATVSQEDIGKYESFIGKS